MEFPNIIAPTISQVLAWLRKEKSIFIFLNLLNCGYSYEISRFEWEDNYVYTDPEFCYLRGYKTYEEAALVGIKHVLDNLSMEDYLSIELTKKLLRKVLNL